MAKACCWRIAGRHSRRRSRGYWRARSFGRGWVWRAGAERQDEKAGAKQRDGSGFRSVGGAVASEPLTAEVAEFAVERAVSGADVGNGVAIHGHCPSQRDGPTTDCGAGIQGDAGVCDDVSCEVSTGTERRGTVDVPKHAGPSAAIDYVNNRAARGREGAANQKDEDRIRIVLGVEGQGSRHCGRRAEFIDARVERASAQIGRNQVHSTGRQGGQRVVRSRGIALRLARDRVG
jgi:hypothetical protein